MDAPPSRLRLRRLSLHGAMLASMLAICLVVVGLDSWRTAQERAAVLAVDAAETASVAGSLAQHAHDTLQGADTVLAGLRERIETDAMSDDRSGSLRGALAPWAVNLRLVNDWAWMDVNGKTVIDSRSHPPGFRNATDRAYFQFHRSHPSRAAYVGDPVQSKADRSWIVTVSRRVDAAGGTFDGIVLATISIGVLQEFYQQFDLGREGLIRLISDDGRVIARMPASEAMVGAMASGDQFARAVLAQGKSGAFADISPGDGVTRLGSVREVDGYNLFVVVAHSRSDVLAAWRRSAALHLAISLGAVSAMGIVGSFFARRISRAQQAERRYRLLAENSSDAIICTGFNGQPLYVSPAFTTLTGWSIEEAMGRDWSSMVHADERPGIVAIAARLQTGSRPATASFRSVCKDGQSLWVEARMQRVEESSDENTPLVINIRDITERKAAEDRVAILNRELTVQANTDALTGLANRRRFNEAITQEWRRAARDTTPLSLLMVDVDRFKLYNDRYGHQQGDQCLRAVAQAIAESARRPADVTARYGGEEFAVLVPGTNAAGAAQLGEIVRAAVEGLGWEHLGSPPSLCVTVSIGVATLYPQPFDDGREAEKLVAAADVALYEAKHGGRNRVMCQATLPQPVV